MQDRNMPKMILFVMLVVVLVSVSGCADSANAAEPIGDPDAGREIYETGGEAGIPCASCHSLDGTRIVGPSWDGLAARAETRVNGMSAVEYLRESIVDPSAYVVEDYQDVMPDHFGEDLSDE